MSWSFLTGLLEEIHNHSTFVGKLWLTVFIVFRIVLTAVGGESIYFDEQSNFVCNSGQPGCDNFCYNAFAPLSHVRFWIFQIILVATPSLMYLGYAMNKIARTEEGKAVEADRPTPRKREQQHQRIEQTEDDDDEDPIIYEVPEMESRSKATPQEKQPETRHDGRQRIREDGLMCMYVLQLLARTLLEVGFLVGQYALYGFAVPPRYICTGKPCPHSVDCFVSRPTEKTIFLLIMYGVTVLCLALNVWELLHLGVGTISDILHSHRSPTEVDESTDLSNVKIVCKQNRANVAQEEQQQFGSTEENLAAVDARNTLQREIRRAQGRLEAAIRAYSPQRHSNNSQPRRDRGQRTSSKVLPDKSSGGGGSCSNSSSKSVGGKRSVWI